MGVNLNDVFSKMTDEEMDEMIDDVIFSAYELGMIEGELTKEGKEDYEAWLKRKGKSK